MRYYAIRKSFATRSELCGKWYLESYNRDNLGFHTDKITHFVADSRKSVKEYAAQNRIVVSFIDSGRRPAGAKW